MIELVASPAGYELQPKSTSLRLFPDSAAYLLGAGAVGDDSLHKRSVPKVAGLAFRDRSAPLDRPCLLGGDHDAAMHIARLPAPAALKEMLRHSLIPTSRARRV